MGFAFLLHNRPHANRPGIGLPQPGRPPGPTTQVSKYRIYGAVTALSALTCPFPYHELEPGPP